MKHETRLTQREQEQIQSGAVTRARSGIADFATPEEALRRDREQTEVPPGIETRLRASVAAEPASSTRSEPGWWGRLFRR